MRSIVVVGMLLLALPALAQDEQTLFGPNSTVEHGGFFAPVAKATKINGKLGMLAGARAGWIIDHAVSLGLGGYYLVSNVAADAPGVRNDPYVNLYYGGLELELIAESNSLVHLSLNGLAGMGAVGTRFALFSQRDRYRSMAEGGYSYHHHHHDGDGDWGWKHPAGIAAGQMSDAPVNDATAPLPGVQGRMDAFYVLEPGANIDFNFTESFRLSLGGSYRWVKGVNSTASTNKQLTGPSAMLTVRFGKF